MDQEENFDDQLDAQIKKSWTEVMMKEE